MQLQNKTFIENNKASKSKTRQKQCQEKQNDQAFSKQRKLEEKKKSQIQDENSNIKAQNDTSHGMVVCLFVLCLYE